MKKNNFKIDFLNSKSPMIITCSYELKILKIFVWKCTSVRLAVCEQQQIVCGLGEILHKQSGFPEARRLEEETMRF